MFRAVESFRNDWRFFALAYAVILVVFQVAFIKESILVLMRVVFSLFWLFIIPGYFVTQALFREMKLLTRLVLGSAIAAAIIGTLSYYLGLLGFHIKYHGLVLPIAIVIISIAWSVRRENNT